MKLKSLVRSPDVAWATVLVTASIFLTAFTVYDQVFHRTGLTFLWEEQLRFHRWVIEGTSVDPWQYRVLAPYLMEGAMRLALRLGYEGPQVMVFVATRLAQNLVVFLTAGVYWRRLGLSRAQTLLGSRCSLGELRTRATGAASPSIPTSMSCSTS